MMSSYDQKVAPKREERLKTCIAHSGGVCGMGRKAKACMIDDGERGFTQGSICLLLVALAILNAMPETVVLIHGAVGCGSCAHSQNANTRSGGAARTGQVKDAIWLSTALNEVDVISGAEGKLGKAIREADQRYRPKTIAVVSGCVPGLIGDDIDSVIAELQPSVSARLVPVHCEGFKTRIWATAYDAVYHGIGRNLLTPRIPEVERATLSRDGEQAELLEQEKLKRTVNLMNVSSMGRVDELELERLIQGLGLEANIFPVFTHPDAFHKATRAALSVSTCPTHDDYFLRQLQEQFGVPFLIKRMPIGIRNTSLWLKDIAGHFGLGATADRIIEAEEREARAALEQFRPLFEGRKVFLSAGEFRALVTAQLLEEMGFEVSGIRMFHHDEFADDEYDKLAATAKTDYTINVANVQPFEEANLLKRVKPDLFLGHVNGNSTAAKLGIPTHTIYNTGLAYIGYRGAFEVARRLHRTLKNPAFNRNLSVWANLPYSRKWYEADPFSHLHSRGDAL
jgi:nitrogenase molybdenum-iron protein alpha chain